MGLVQLEGGGAHAGQLYVHTKHHPWRSMPEGGGSVQATHESAFTSAICDLHVPRHQMIVKSAGEVGAAAHEHEMSLCVDLDIPAPIVIIRHLKMVW